MYTDIYNKTAILVRSIVELGRVADFARYGQSHIGAYPTSIVRAKATIGPTLVSAEGWAV